MPFPLGHTAIGVAAYETARPSESSDSHIGLFIYITLLANLPDIDILFGLLVKGNGAAFHRGPTHSLMFALAAGFLASRAPRLWRRIPKIPFGLCALLIFSHVAADLVFTTSPVSMFWPFETHWSLGFHGWAEVTEMALLQSLQDFMIAGAAALYLLVLRKVRRGISLTGGLLAFARRRVRSAGSRPIGRGPA